MKKKMLIMMMALVLILSACGKNNEENTTKETIEESTEQETTKENEEAEKPENPKTGSEITYEALMSIPPTPLDDFEWSRTPEGDLHLGIYKGQDAMVYIADEYDGKKVVEIGGYAYNHNPYVKAIRLGKNLRLLEKGVFGTNEVLEIFVAEGLEVIGEGAFVNAISLREVRLNEGLKQIGGSAFFACKSLKEITLPKTIEEITPGAFYLNDNLVIKGYAGTIAKEVAEINEVKYEEIQE